jgi:hypothetical protein
VNINLCQLLVRTKRTTETIFFTDVTFLHGPVGTGKSTVARLVDYCFGGEVERTPAIQQEFVTAELMAELGGHPCIIERGSTDTQDVRVTWTSAEGDQSVNVPLVAQAQPVVGDDVYNLSDLLFHLCGVTPIKVRKNSREAEAPLIRLSFRDIWAYCYLDQTHLDSSFFRLDDPFRGRKSQDAMRFFTGLHSERLSQLDSELSRTIEEQRVKRESVAQIRAFMTRFELGSELEMSGQLQDAARALTEAQHRRAALEASRSADTHPSDDLRGQLRRLGSEIAQMQQALAESGEALGEQRALRAELITAKTKALRADHAGQILAGVEYQCCPQCGTDVSSRLTSGNHCRLCGSEQRPREPSPMNTEVRRRDLNERIDQIADSMLRRQQEIARTERYLARARTEKAALDGRLQEELARYDSSFIESIREVERQVATWTERIRSLNQLRQMPEAITALEDAAGALQGRIDTLRSAMEGERARLKAADANIAEIADAFKRTMLAVNFPGVSASDEVVIDPRTWVPVVVHGAQVWGFWDTGSGGKKTLYNVCYAIALHSVAMERNLPVPTLLIIDSPTKNISEDENPELVRALYAEVYRLATRHGGGRGVQLVLIDSDMVAPRTELAGFTERRMAAEDGAPALIPYYDGP